VPTGAVVSASLNGGRPAWPGGVGAPVIGRENRCFVVVDKIGGGFRELAERRAKTTRATPRVHAAADDLISRRPHYSNRSVVVGPVASASTQHRETMQWRNL